MRTTLISQGDTCQATVTNNNHNDINNKNNDANMNARVPRLVLCDRCQVSCAWRRLLINQNIGARRRTSICGLGGNSDFICAEFTSAPKLKNVSISDQARCPALWRVPCAMCQDIVANQPFFFMPGDWRHATEARRQASSIFATRAWARNSWVFRLE